MNNSVLRIWLCAFACLLAASGAAWAHPHVWVTMKAELIYAPDGSMTGVRHAWTFDDMFSVFATQGIDAKTQGQFTREELMPLAQTNVESLKDFDYFTFAESNGKQMPFAEPLADYYLEYDPKETMLTLHFTLPLKTAAKVKDVNVDVYDPSYFVDFSFAQKDPAALVGAPAQCKLSVAKPQELDASLAGRLSQMPADAQLDPSQYLSSQFANKIVVKCP